MQIKNKKGLEKTVLAAMIIAIVAGLLVFVLFMKFAGFLGGTAANEVLFNLCQGNVKIRDKFAAHRVVALFLCPENKADLVTVHADNWKKCDPDGEFNFKKNKNKKMCATIQFTQLAKRCFDMYGSGALTLTVEESGKYGCYQVEMKNLGSITLDEFDFNRAMRLLGRDHGYCGHKEDCGQIKEDKAYFNNHECRFGADDCDEGHPLECGNCDNIDMSADVNRNIKSGKENFICFDERGSGYRPANHDAVLINDPGCPRGEKRAAPLAEETEHETRPKGEVTD